MLEDLEPRGVSATAECCCAEAGVGLVSPLSQSAQTTKAQNLFSVQQGKAIQPAIVQKGRKLRSETGKNATRSQSSHGQNKRSRQRQQKQAKGGNTVCFCSKLCVNLYVCFRLWCWRPCLCLYHSKCVSFVLLDKLLDCWKGAPVVPRGSTYT